MLELLWMQSIRSLPSLQVPLWPGVVAANAKGREKYKNKGDKKGGKGRLLLFPEIKVCLYFLKSKTTSFHKVIYFKRNKLYKIRLCIFFPMLVENIE